MKLIFMNYLYGTRREAFITVATKSDTNCYNNVFASLINSGGSKRWVVLKLPFTMKNRLSVHNDCKNSMGSKKQLLNISIAPVMILIKEMAPLRLKAVPRRKNAGNYHVEQYDA
jgi:hypothetical protein